MKTKILLPIVLLAIIAILGASLANEVVQNHRISRSLKHLKANQLDTNDHRQSLQFMMRTAQDRGKYTPAQLNDAEQLYQIANQKWGTPEAKDSLQTMVQKFPDINRTGCAVLYLCLLYTSQVDAANDLALLKADGKFSPLPIAASRSAHLGGTVATIGFPDPSLQGFSPKLAKGEIASLSGAGDDPRYFQISAPVQPGNSGGALVDSLTNGC